MELGLTRALALAVALALVACATGPRLTPPTSAIPDLRGTWKGTWGGTPPTGSVPCWAMTRSATGVPPHVPFRVPRRWGRAQVGGVTPGPGPLSADAPPARAG